MSVLDQPCCGECSIILEPADVCQDEHGLLCLRCYNEVYACPPAPVSAPVLDVRARTTDELLSLLREQLDRMEVP